jgi:hypothetical protein
VRNLNRRRAIRHHCHMCSDFVWSGVIHCQFKDCGLYDFRLGGLQEKGLTPRDRENAIWQYCAECARANDTDPPNCDAVECALFPYRCIATAHYAHPTALS